MRPIPKRLLIHTVMVYRVAEKDAWGEKRLDNGKEVRHVRIEPSSKIVRDKNNAEIQLAATLFFDCKYSQPNCMRIREDDIIDFQGKCFRVQMVESLYDGRRLHHYEIGLVGYAKDKDKGYL